ncbi:WD40 repeat domain-containing protein [Streptomyces sp. 130]|uniref:WD40 repeat domain-containing protein n=1 Tax=Streptomyces sp. 130 TaxID=2591006 RepID=UPI00117FDF7E|nr:WD40 repeat domain-containing protein [Streptomyces sp. 130]TRV72643.1 WD40 repeat domain-containing protein [Streptomyces sp. 130]
MKRVRLLDVREGRLRDFEIKLAQSPSEIRFTPDGRTLVTVGYDGQARTWDTANGDLLRSMSPSVPDQGTPMNGTTVAATPDGRTVAVSAPERGVVLLTPENGRQRLVADQEEESADPIESLAFTPDGGTLAIGGRSGRIRLVDVGTGRVEAPLQGASAVQGLAFAPEGDTLAVLTSDRNVSLWDVPSHKLRASYPGGQASHDVTIHDIAFGPDRQTLLTSDEADIRIWSLDGFQPYATADPPPGSAYGLVFDPAGQNLAGAGFDGPWVWDAETGREMHHYSNEYEVQPIAYDRRGHLLSAVDDWNGLTVEDLTAPASTVPIRDTEGSGTVHKLALSADGGTLAMRRGTRLSVWDTETGRPRTPQTKTAGTYSDLLLSHDGSTLAASRVDGPIELRDTATGKLRTRLVTSLDEPLAFSPNGQTLVTGGFHGVRLWRTTTGGLRATLDKNDGTQAAAYSDDGRFLATAGRSGKVSIWDTATDRLQQVVPASVGSVASLALTADGHRLAVGGQDGGVELWRLSLPHAPEEAVRQICRTVGRDLTKQERSSYLPDPSAPPACPA